MKYKAAFFCNSEPTVDRVYGDERVARIASLCDLYPTVISSANAADNLNVLENVEVVFSTWGMPVLPEALIDKMTKLRCILYGASSVKSFAKPYLRRGITVVTAAYANGEFVARYTMSQIFLCAKGYFRVLRELPHDNAPVGGFGLTVGVVGAGNIGRLVTKLLLADGHTVKIYDPYLTEDIGAKQTTLEEIFSTCDIVTNHAPNTPETEKMLTGALFASMKKGAYFINTGRGASVEEDAMAEVFANRSDLTALLDVTWPEPAVPGSPVTKPRNILITPHIAGALGGEVKHMADYCIEQFELWESGKRPTGAVDPDKLRLLS